MLTAAHVVCPDDRPLAQVQVRAPGGELLAGRVIWQRPAGETDVALVEVTDPRWVPPRRRVRWGRLVTTRPRQRFEATGFPDVAATPAWRDTEQASGTINPGNLVKARRLALAVDDPPARVRDSESPWAGMSGAAVFCRGLLTAVVIEDPAGFASQRLTAVPVVGFAGDEAFTALFTTHTGSPAQPGPVELRSLAVPSPVADSPPALLRADLAPTPFRDRPELHALLGWCHTDVEWAARVLVGPGGQGKTRLARRVAELVEVEGWASLVLADTAHPTELEVLAQLAVPVLVVVDYAETRIAQLGDLTRHLRDCEQPVRLLLLARTAGSWQAAAAAGLAGTTNPSWPSESVHAADLHQHRRPG